MAKYRDLQLLRDKVFRESLDLANRIGFRDDVIQEVVKTNSVPAHLQRVLFPNGKIDIAYYFMNNWLEETVQAYKPIGNFEQNISSAARTRLEMMSLYKNLWTDYANLPCTLAHYWSLSDKLLLLAGSTQYDLVYYTRRLELKKTLIDAEEMYIKTPAENETIVWNFLDREVDRIINHSYIGSAADIFSIVANTGLSFGQAFFPEPINSNYSKPYTPSPSNLSSTPSESAEGDNTLSDQIGIKN